MSSRNYLPLLNIGQFVRVCCAGLGVAASVPCASLTVGTGRGQSRWFRVEACFSSGGARLTWGRPEPEFGVPAQSEAVARFEYAAYSVKRTGPSSFINH